MGTHAPGDPAKLTEAQYRRFCAIAYEQAGIHIKEGKEALVASRVARRMKALGVTTPRHYLRYLEADMEGEEVLHFVDAITTNFTRFFREPEHFDFLRQFAAEQIEKSKVGLKIWCAAAATGEEPYSLSMALQDVPATQHFECRILATDISTRALDVARAGIYPEKALADLGTHERNRFFLQREGVSGRKVWEVRPEIRAPIVFDRVNLAHPPFPMRGPFDFIFCRNVMIYFDSAVRAQLVGEMEKLLRPGGMLAVGHAETLTGIPHGLKALRPSLYLKR